MEYFKILSQEFILLFLTYGICCNFFSPVLLCGWDYILEELFILRKNEST